MPAGVLFRAGGEAWSVPVEEVRAVVRVETRDSFVRVPGAPPEVAGLVNVRGEVLPAIKTARMIGANGTEPATTEPGTAESWALVVEDGGTRAALLVDEVLDVAEVEAGEQGGRLTDGSFVGMLGSADLLGRVRRGVAGGV